MPVNSIYRSFIHTDTFKSAGGSADSEDPELPLLSTLPGDIQAAVKRYVRLQDRQMSLASALLKYHFIHRIARIPWKEIVISKTPDPHRRPYWDPKTAPSSARNGKEVHLEFNVSHQAGLVGLTGCILPEGTVPLNSGSLGQNAHTSTASPGAETTVAEPAPTPLSSDTQSSTKIRLGLDITCADEPGRGPRSKMETMTQLNEWISIFTDVFSPADISRMKHAPLDPTPSPGLSEVELVKAKLRRFYTFFALQEAYVKMTGEALLANWLKEVEYRNVKVPSEAAEENEWAEVVDTSTEVWLKGKRLDEIKTEIRAWGKSFIVATAIDGLEDGSTSVPPKEQWRFLQWKEEVAPCALGTCHCLE